MADGLGIGSGAMVAFGHILVNQTIAAGASVVSEAVRIRDFARNGNFSLGLYLTGAGGKIDAQYLLSLDGTNYVVPSAATSIVSSFSTTSGTSGRDIISFCPEVAPFLKVRLVETAMVSTATANAWLSVA